MAGDVKPQETPGLSPWDVLFWKLDERINRLEERTDRELTALRGEIGGLHQELRGTRHSSGVRQLTTVLGFLAVLVSFWIAR
ncbi:MAG TPA: hypothetical protein DEQ28_02095 [Clostridiales bacterium]|nr:hypothetical protein [Clostridiales bacterium]